MTVDQFEALVQSQKPARTSWLPVTDYSFEARRVIEGQQPALIKECFQPKNALDYGCGAGYLVALLSEIGVRVKGYEPSESLREMVPPYVKWLVSSSTWDNAMNGRPDVYDLVICREVLEHLTVLDIRKTVHELCRISGQFVYVTTRFTQNWTMPHAILSVDTKDDLDPTHITMLNKDLLRLLFVLEGFKRRADLEERMDWQRKGRCLVYERA